MEYISKYTLLIDKNEDKSIVCGEYKWRHTKLNTIASSLVLSSKLATTRTNFFVQTKTICTRDTNGFIHHSIPIGPGWFFKKKLRESLLDHSWKEYTTKYSNPAHLSHMDQMRGWKHPDEPGGFQVSSIVQISSRKEAKRGNERAQWGVRRTRYWGPDITSGGFAKCALIVIQTAPGYWKPGQHASFT